MECGLFSDTFIAVTPFCYGYGFSPDTLSYCGTIRQQVWYQKCRFLLPLFVDRAKERNAAFRPMNGTAQVRRIVPRPYAVKGEGVGLGFFSMNGKGEHKPKVKTNHLQSKNRLV